MSKKKIVIDCDPGHDDVMAILTAYAHPENFDILGITTVAGNQTIEKVTRNILCVQEYCGMNIPVSAGYGRPLLRDAEPQPGAHGETGLDGFVFPDPVRKPTGLHAVTFLKNILEANEHVTIVALAPLTNIAILLRTFPDLSAHLDQIVLMGGGIHHGNILPEAEFNIYHDPEAAHIVFNSSVPIVMAPLEACESAPLLLSEVPQFHTSGRIGQMVEGLLDFYCGYARARNWDRTAVFDLLPVVWLLHPEYFISREMNVGIEMSGRYTRGMTVCDERSSIALSDHPVTVLTSADREKVIGCLQEAIKILDRR